MRKSTRFGARLDFLQLLIFYWMNGLLLTFLQIIMTVLHMLASSTSDYSVIVPESFKKYLMAWLLDPVRISRTLSVDFSRISSMVFTSGSVWSLEPSFVFLNLKSIKCSKSNQVMTWNRYKNIVLLGTIKRKTILLRKVTSNTKQKLVLANIFSFLTSILIFFTYRVPVSTFLEFSKGSFSSISSTT